MDPVKVDALTDWPKPTPVKEMHSFLGFGNYYKECLLHELIKKNVQLHWTDKEQNTFNALKLIFTSYPILRNPDPDKCYIVDTNASAFAVGATVSQDFPNGRHPIVFFSKSLLPAER